MGGRGRLVEGANLVPADVDASRVAGWGRHHHVRRILGIERQDSVDVMGVRRRDGPLDDGGGVGACDCGQVRSRERIQRRQGPGYQQGGDPSAPKATERCSPREAIMFPVALGDRRAGSCLLLVAKTVERSAGFVARLQTLEPLGPPSVTTSHRTHDLSGRCSAALAISMSPQRASHPSGGRGMVARWADSVRVPRPGPPPVLLPDGPGSSAPWPGGRRGPAHRQRRSGLESGGSTPHRAQRPAVRQRSGLRSRRGPQRGGTGPAAGPCYQRAQSH